MVLKQLKTKAVKQFIELFNADDCRQSGITVNDVYHTNVCSLTLDGDFILLNRRIINYGIITVGCIMIDDLRNMSYITNEPSVVSLDNIEL